MPKSRARREAADLPPGRAVLYSDERSDWPMFTLHRQSRRSFRFRLFDRAGRRQLAAPPEDLRADKYLHSFGRAFRALRSALAAR